MQTTNYNNINTKSRSKYYFLQLLCEIDGGSSDKSSNGDMECVFVWQRHNVYSNNSSVPHKYELNDGWRLYQSSWCNKKIMKKIYASIQTRKKMKNKTNSSWLDEAFSHPLIMWNDIPYQQHPVHPPTKPSPTPLCFHSVFFFFLAPLNKLQCTPLSKLIAFSSILRAQLWLSRPLQRLDNFELKLEFWGKKTSASLYLHHEEMHVMMMKETTSHLFTVE